MNYPIEDLDDCIFYYLVSKKDKLQSANKIYKNITSEVGHRCSELNNSILKDVYKKKFLASCYILHKKYDNVYNVNKNDNIYLIYTKEKKNNIADDIVDIGDIGDIVDIGDKNGELFSITKEDVAKYIIDNFDNYLDYNFNDFFNSKYDFYEYMILNNKYNEFKKALKLNNSLVDNKMENKLINLALRNNKATMAEILLKFKFKNRINNLRIENRNYKNTIQETKMKTIKLTFDLTKYKRQLIVTHLFYIVIIYFLFYC